MQPDQQNQSPQPNPNIPDYLGFEPIAEPKPRKSLKLPLILVFSLLLLFVAGFAGYSYWSQNTPTAVFYRAIGQLMETHYAEQNIATTLTLKDTFVESSTMTVMSDFSNVKSPKSQINHEYKIDNVNPKTQDTTTSGELVIPGEAEYYARITEMTGHTEKGVQLNSWTTINEAAGNLGYIYDKYNLRQSLNNPFSLVVIGNLKEHRQKLVNHLQNSGIYKIVGDRERADGNKNYRVFSVDIDYQKLNEFHKTLMKELGVNFMPLRRETTGKAEFWIDKSTNRLSRVKENTAQTHDGLVFDMSLDMHLSYPASVSVSKPEGVQ